MAQNVYQHAHKSSRQGIDRLLEKLFQTYKPFGVQQYHGTHASARALTSKLETDKDKVYRCLIFIVRLSKNKSG